jgi:hypothetical protein
LVVVLLTSIKYVKCKQIDERKGNDQGPN